MIWIEGQHTGKLLRMTTDNFPQNETASGLLRYGCLMPINETAGGRYDDRFESAIRGRIQCGENYGTAAWIGNRIHVRRPFWDEGAARPDSLVFGRGCDAAARGDRRGACPNSEERYTGPTVVTEIRSASQKPGLSTSRHALTVGAIAEEKSASIGLPSITSAIFSPMVTWISAMRISRRLLLGVAPEMIWLQLISKLELPTFWQRISISIFADGLTAYTESAREFGLIVLIRGNCVSFGDGLCHARQSTTVVHICQPLLSSARQQ